MVRCGAAPAGGAWGAWSAGGAARARGARACRPSRPSARARPCRRPAVTGPVELCKRFTASVSYLFRFRIGAAVALDET